MDTKKLFNYLNWTRRWCAYAKEEFDPVCELLNVAAHTKISTTDIIRIADYFGVYLTPEEL